MNATYQQEWKWESLDFQLVNYIVRVENNCDVAVKQAIKILSHEVRQGHVCIRLEEYSNIDFDETGQTPETQQWVEILRASHVVGKAGDIKPLILDESDKLYFHRYWQYEDQLAKNLMKKSQASIQFSEDDVLKNQLDTMFGSDDQKNAIKNAVKHSFSVISGGPGTGKTTTVASLLHLLHRLQPNIRIALAAPTGKAAARMQEAITRAIVDLSAQEQENIPNEAVTIHRLLGYRAGKVTFRYNAATPLPFDAIIIDEASMIDLALMKKLLDAIPEQARLILIGDRYQLASVEAGAVFGEICAETSANTLSENFTLLSQGFRFDSITGIGQLAKAINSGNATKVFNILLSAEYPDVTWLDTTENSNVWHEPLKAKLLHQLKLFENNDSAEKKFEMMAEFQLLCAHRRGRDGVESVTDEIERWIQPSSATRNRNWYSGKPVMVIENNYQTKLFNGDVGFAVRGEDGRIQVVFQVGKGDTLALSTARLPAHETAWAISVHKSQGSEFDEVMLLLPEQASPVITRELIYTAVTRARKKITIVGNRAVINHAVGKPVVRRSGLASKLRRHIENGV